MAIGRLASNRWGASLLAASVTPRIFERADAVEQSRTRCATAFPCNARGTGLVADLLCALRRDDILVTACYHIKGNVEAANSLRRATQSGNRRCMAGKARQRTRSEQQAVIMLHCLCPDHDIANGWLGRETPGRTGTDHEFGRRKPADEVLRLNGELCLSVPTRCHQDAPVRDICGVDLEIVKALDMKRRLERTRKKRPFPI